MNFSHAPRGLIAAAALVAVSAASHMATAGDPYLDAMAACQEAAAKSEDPTDFECDWKKVVTGAPGSALTGRFKFREPGMSGVMTILEPGFEPAQIGISTVTESENTPTCTAAFGASRNDNDELAATMDDPSGCEVRIVSILGDNLVKVTSTDACRDFCGNGAAFDGEWQLLNE